MSSIDSGARITGADAAAATTPAMSRLGATFMSDPSLAARGRELGYDGIDFYLVGRAGAVGDIDAEAATAALVFFHPAVVRQAWERTASLLSRRDAATEFAACAAAWADEHVVGHDVDWARLHGLTQQILAAAPLAGAPIYAGWTALARPASDLLQTCHAMNALREFRMSRHAAAILANRVPVGDAVRHRQPGMIAMFGWERREVSTDVVERWRVADALTNELVGQAYDVLDSGELQEFVELTTAAAASIR